MQKEVVEILATLEEFRKNIESGEVHAGSADWVIRMCQAKIADGVYQSRREWSELLESAK